MRQSLLAALCICLTTLPVSGASLPFVTAGYSLYPPPAVFATPDLMWSNTPAGQEFVSAVPRIDFVEVYFGNGAIAHYQIILHEQTITGAVVAVSEIVLRDYSGTGMTRFHFSPPAAVSPGATYVLEFVRQEPIAGAENSPEIYRPGGDYAGGNRIWQGVPESRRDLYFRGGVFMSSLFSTNQATTIADGVTRPFDPAATFENPYLTSFDGATLKWTLHSASADSISLASGGAAEIAIAPETGDIYYNSGAVSFARVLTNDAGSHSITVQFNANADANAVGAVLRSLLFTAPERVPIPVPYPWPPLVSISLLRVTFSHSFGEATDERHFFAVRPNTPPPTRIFHGGHAFLDGARVLITRRLQPTVSMECNLWSLTDNDGDPLTFEWRLRPDPTILSTLPRFTNDYAPGTHWVDATVSDGKISVVAETTFEVITPTEAMTRLRADLAQNDLSNSDLGNTKRRLEMPLRFAAYAIRHRQWDLAARQLKMFQKRLDRYYDALGGEQLYTRWSGAAGDIKYSVAHLRRIGSFPGPGPFPIPPATPMPQPR